MAFDLHDPKQRLAYWNDVARKVLINRRIVAARYPTKAEAKRGIDGLLICLDNGTIFMPMSDDEGNGPGALHFVGTFGQVSKNADVKYIRTVGGVLPILNLG